MNKLNLRSLLAIVFSLLAMLSIVSCEDVKVKTFSELKEEEATAIERLIKDKNLQVEECKLDKLPAYIDKNIYYKMPNGLYLRVIDAGKTKIQRDDKINLMFKGFMFSKEEANLFSLDNLSKANREITSFIYTHFYNQGDVHFRLIPQESVVPNYDRFMCEGLAYPMSLLGDGAIVSLIIPFKLGPKDTYKDGLSMFVEEVQYQLQK